MLKWVHTLEKKVILSLLFVSMALILTHYGILKLSVYATFDQLEQQESVKNQTRAISTVNTQYEKLSLIIREYSEWDDTYYFVQDILKNDFASNFSEDYFNSIGIDFVLIVDRKGSVKWAYLSDPEGNLINLPEQLLEPLNEDHPLVDLNSTGREIRGFWGLRSGLMMTLSRPVLRSDGTGDANGSIVMGQYFGENLVAELSTRSAAMIRQFDIDSGVQALLRSNSGSMQEVAPGLLSLERAGGDDERIMRSIELQLLSRLWAPDEQQAGQPNKLSLGMDHHSVHDHLIYQDLFEKPQGILQVTTPRNISKLGTNSLFWAMLSMLAATVIIGLVFIVIMRVTLFKPIQTIQSHMLRMGKSGNLKTRLGMNRADEIGTLAMVFDQFTEKLDSAQKQLEAARDQALLLAKTKSGFLATMSHEIRTPMNGVLGMAELLSRTDLDGPQRKFLQNIQSSGDLLLTVINDILDFSQIEAGKLKPEARSFNLRELVQETTDVMAIQASGKGIALTHSFPLEFHEWVIGDAKRLRQVLVNLISNAIKFTDQGGVTVKVTVEKERSSLQSILIEIIDTGVGIQQDQQKKIFEEFIQADSGSLRKYGGTGLGLSISTQLIELMGGSIGLNSTVGLGSRFWIALHLPTALAPHSATEPLSSFKGVKILIADTDEISRKILNTHIVAWGMSGDNAVDGLQALEMLHKAATDNTPYQLVLLDYKMPGIDGIEVARQIREDRQLSNMKVVLLGSATTVEMEQLLRSGHLDYFLSKPVKQGNLSQCMVKLITGEKQSEELQNHESPIIRLKAHVLIAEDNLVNQEVVRYMLKTMGVTAHIANDGAEAVSMSGKRDYDLILMDCHMPEMDGYLATNLIRQSEEENSPGALRTPVIALTADAHEGAYQECIGAGMDDYLPKPVTMRQLQEMLIKWLPESNDHHDHMTRDVSGKTDKNLFFEPTLSFGQ